MHTASPLRIPTLLVILSLGFLGCSKEKDSSAGSVTPAPSPTINASELIAPTLVAPPNNVQQIWSPINFSWNPVPNAVCYEARAWYYSNSGTQSTFGLLSVPCHSTTTYTGSSNLGTWSTSNSWSGKTIYWHVRACLSQSNCGPWSTTYSFRLRNQ